MRDTTTANTFRRADGYVGRFAPSPSGPLHAGSIVAALASWLDAKAHHGRWLLRIEDVDSPRTQPGAVGVIQSQLRALGLHHDGEVIAQSSRSEAYRLALSLLKELGHAYPCTCTRAMVESSRYPGTCRTGPSRQGASQAWRLRVEPGPMIITHWHDRRLGAQSQDIASEVGDFILQRSDGPFAYQLVVVIDDAHQGVSDVVRGEDLCDNTPRQRLLQHLLGLPPVRYLHVPLLLGIDGQKLSKSLGAAPAQTGSTAEALAVLRRAAHVLGLHEVSQDDSLRVDTWLNRATAAWRARYPLP
jgi:glutamyl-Q tRNA(Asp) synthetase